MITLSVHVPGLGELTARGVELAPDAGGVRMITGPVRIDGRAGPLGIEVAFARSAAELTLPHLALTSEPTAMSRRVRRTGGLDPDSTARVDGMLRAMRRDGVLDREQLGAARAAAPGFAPAALSQER